MKRVYTKQSVLECRSQLILIPYMEKISNNTFDTLDNLHHQLLSKTAALHAFSGKTSEVLPVVLPTGQTILVAGLGKQPTANTWRDVLAKCATIATNKKLSTIAVYLDRLDDMQLSYCVEGLTFGAYRFDKYKSKSPSPVISQIKFGISSQATSHATGSKIVRRASIRADAVCKCRDMVNEPTNKLDTAKLVSLIKKEAKSNHLQCKVIAGAALRQKGFGLIDAVGKGASHPPAFIELRYSPDSSHRVKAHSIALIGKGVVFDSGGLCLKPAEYMTSMKTDMAGAAVVFCVMSVLSRLQIAYPVTAYIPIAENAIGEHAVRPGDVVTSYNGKTVEVVNTDAEGRLLLADAIAYAEKQSFDEIVDFATLTGSSTIALGRKRGAIFSNNDALVSKWLHLAEETGEYLWPLPLAKELESELRSDVADLKNSGNRFGGAISAALFLKRFTRCANWVHFDIAGPARNSTSTFSCPKGGTGFLVLTTLRYLESSTENKSESKSR